MIVETTQYTCMYRHVLVIPLLRCWCCLTMVMCAVANAEHHGDTSADMDIDTFLAGGFESFADGDAVVHSRHSRGTVAMKSAKRARESKSANRTKTEKGRRAHTQPHATDPGTVPGNAVSSAVEQELTSHKAQLEKLRTADPSFYQYLVESDKALLSFSDDEDLVSPAHAIHTDGMDKQKERIGAGQELCTTGSTAADSGYNTRSGVHPKMLP